jgi:hypothetical protein
MIGQFLSGGIILGSPSLVPTYSYAQPPWLQMAVTHPLPFVILLLNWCQEYSYRLRNQPVKSTLDTNTDRVVGGSRLAVGRVIV